MATHFQTIALITKQGDRQLAPALTALLRHLESLGRSVLLDEAAAALAGRTGQPMESLAAEADLVVVLGGDGTMLKVARATAPHTPPLVGINAGRLGFLTDLPATEASHHLDRILAGEFQQENRSLLRMRMRDTTGLALNDVVVQKRDGGRMIEFETWVDGAFVCAHRADGIVITTPTGSTAYALSSGGPILQPGIDAIALVPICPHTLSDRPLVVDGNSRIDIVLAAGRGVEAQVTCDGQSGTELAAGGTVRVERAAERVSLLHPVDYDYFRILRGKLHWGRDKYSDRER